MAGLWNSNYDFCTPSDAAMQNIYLTTYQNKN